MSSDTRTKPSRSRSAGAAQSSEDGIGEHAMSAAPALVFKRSLARPGGQQLQKRAVFRSQGFERFLRCGRHGWIARPADSACVTRVGEQHHSRRANLVCQSVVYFLKGDTCRMEILWVGVMRDEVAFSPLGDDRMTREERGKQRHSGPRIGGATCAAQHERRPGWPCYRSTSGHDLGNRSAFGGAKEILELFSITMRIAQLRGRWRILICRYSNHQAPNGNVYPAEAAPFAQTSGHARFAHVEPMRTAEPATSLVMAGVSHHGIRFF